MKIRQYGVGISLVLAHDVRSPQPFNMLVVSLVAALPLAGCAQSSSSRIERWLHERGGVLTGPVQQRATEAFKALSVWSGERDLKITVLDSDDVAAYCWPSGEIVVTRGLLELVDDQELAAAIAHEVGHLLADGHLPHHAALAGCQSDPDAETEADLVARELLRSGGLQHHALAGLLRKIASHPRTTPACRQQLNRRIARLAALH